MVLSESRYRGGVLKILLILLGLGIVACTGPDSGQDNKQDDYKRQLADARKLNSLPYVTSPRVRAENQGLRGVVHHETEAAYAGLNLYGSMTRHRAFLVDMQGNVVHQWQAEEALPGRRDFVLGPDVLDRVVGIGPGFAVAEIHDDGLLAIESLGGLVKLDWDSNVVFELSNGAHHDLDTMADGTIVVLTAAPRWVDVGQHEIIILDNLIEMVSPAGEPGRQYSLFEILAQNQSTRPLLAKGLSYARHWLDRMDEWQEMEIRNQPAARPAYEELFGLFTEAYVQRTRDLTPADARYVLTLTPADVLHCNTVEILPAHPAGLWPAGSVLVSVRNLDLIMVLDLATRRVLWSWGPDVLSRQHQPSVLPDGNLLVFDNGTARGRSRVVEMNPATGEIVWSYGETDETRFFCPAMGGAQALPNGNVLITESFAGRAFEVQRDGHVVWDFFNPDLGYNPFERHGEAEVIESIYRLGRVDAGLRDGLPGR